MLLLFLPICEWNSDTKQLWGCSDVDHDAVENEFGGYLEGSTRPNKSFVRASGWYSTMIDDHCLLEQFMSTLRVSFHDGEFRVNTKIPIVKLGICE